MPIEQIMKLFLMVAIILVGISFLMRAFEIDILEWLKERLGGLGIPKSGKILHVVLDPFTKNIDRVKVYEFHLTDEKKHKAGPDDEGFTHFMIKENPQDKCIIFTTGDRKTPKPNEGGVYYVNPGSLIQDDPKIKTLKDGLLDLVFGCDERIKRKGGECQANNCLMLSVGVLKRTTCEGKYNLVKCNSDWITEKDTVRELVLEEFSKVVCDNEIFPSERKVMDTPFMDLAQKDDWKCSGGSCNLLKKETYRVQFGLVCGNDGKWHVCKKDVSSVSGFECIIEDENIGRWKLKEIEGLLLYFAPDVPVYYYGQNVKATLVSPSGFKLNAGVGNVIIECLVTTEKCEVTIPLNLLPDKYTLFAKAIKDNIIQQEIKKDVEIDTLITEFTLSDFGEWTGISGTTITTDLTEKYIGDVSIKGSITGTPSPTNNIFMRYDFKSLQNVNQIEFWAKSDKKTGVQVYLQDKDNDIVSSKVTIDIGSFLKFSLAKDKFTKNLAFDWDAIKRIEVLDVDRKTNNIWVDGLFIF